MDAITSTTVKSNQNQVSQPLNSAGDYDFVLWLGTKLEEKSVLGEVLRTCRLLCVIACRWYGLWRRDHEGVSRGE